LRKSLTIIGGGNAGKTLGKLWASHQTFALLDILNRSIESAERAASFIGAGSAVSDYADLRAADIYMIATPDDQIVACCERLARAGRLSAHSIVFHCSGALPSSALQPAIAHGAAVASVHPIRSFAAPEKVAQSFAGTYCGIEGDARAIAVLGDAFSAIGALPVPIDAESKAVYHAAAVFACNYLVTLLDTAMQAYGKAGIPPQMGLKLMEPLVRETIDNVFRLGPAEALTGPIARGDAATVVRQYRAVKAWDKRYGALYKQLGRLTADLARRRGKPKG
jgi:predicted short-subunit dehydrogenase-like oxidoreductase (DUF2520 family)